MIAPMDAFLDFLYQTNVLTVWYFLSSFVIIISVIVFIHEYGHYRVAKWCGVKIEEFAIGFGPELSGWTDRSGTRWKLCLVPMGGYVKMFGDVNPTSAADNEKLGGMTAEQRKLTFHDKPLPQKAAIVSAGPLANFILAIVILTGFIMAYGQIKTLPVIGEVMAESAAAEAGLMPGDRILSIDSTVIEDFVDIQNIISINTGTPVMVEYKRGDVTATVEMTPKIASSHDLFGNEIKRALIGITASAEFYEQQEVSFPKAVWLAVGQTYTISANNLRAIGQIIIGERSIKDMGGPVKISKYSGQAMNQGIRSVLWLMAVLSISLGLINLLPIPALDGGHLLYYVIEVVQGKPLAERYQEYGLKAGMAFILMLAVVVTFNDVFN
jgi:regulator of sigma E protease